jgi:uncharacterized protein involved in exopolysaccharide biosynthesis
MTPTFTPSDTLINAFRNWWAIVALMILGALLGFAASRARPPLYEAHAAISIAIDFSRSGDLEDFEEDYVIGSAGDVIASSEVYAEIASQAGIDPDQLRSSLYLERSYYTWTLRARDASPQRAAELANLWADQAFEELGAALEQALLAERYARQLDLLEDCLVQPSPAPAVCADLDQVQNQIVSVSALERDARALSRGIQPYTLYALVEQASHPTHPTVFNQGQMVLAGALIGFLLAVWAIHLRWPPRLLERSPRAE